MEKSNKVRVGRVEVLSKGFIKLALTITSFCIPLSKMVNLGISLIML